MLKFMLEDVVAQMQHLGITSQDLTRASRALATPGAEHIITNHTFCSLFMDPGPPVPVMLLIGRLPSAAGLLRARQPTLLCRPPLFPVQRRYCLSRGR